MLFEIRSYMAYGMVATYLVTWSGERYLLEIVPEQEYLRRMEVDRAKEN